MSPDTGLYATDATLSYYSASNAVYLNGAGQAVTLERVRNANDRTAINLFGRRLAITLHLKPTALSGCGWLVMVTGLFLTQILVSFTIYEPSGYWLV